MSDVNSTIMDILHTVHSYSAALSPPTLRYLGIENAIAELCQQTEISYDIRVRFSSEGRIQSMGQDLDNLAWHAVQELLTNVVKHARATRVAVWLKARNGFLQVLVHDNGGGMAPEESGAGFSRTGGYGLFALRERTEQIGGVFEVSSRRGSTQVSLTIPLVRRNEHADRYHFGG